MTDTGAVSAAEPLTELANQFGDIARAMIDDGPDGELLIDQVLKFAAEGVPGSEYAAITRVSGNGRPETIAASADLPLRVDLLQYETGEGPCLQTLVQSDVEHAADLAADLQWPAFSARAVHETGIRSMLSFRLFLTAKERGALTFYAHAPHAFTPLSMSTGAIFASYTSLVLTNQFHQDESMNLRRALESNREIGMALGILMARELHTAEQAFTRLRTASQHLHRKLHDVATEVIETGSLPGRS